MRRCATIGVIALLAGCHRHDDPAPARQATGLEAAAIQAGVIADPGDADISGLFAREGDKVCVMPSAKAFRIGASVDLDERQHCSASGTVTHDGEALHVVLDGADGCRFDARYEGDRIVFPGRVPDACQKLCTGRASFAALAVDRLSTSASEAATLQDRDGRLLCGG
ncbi:MAG: hypothetical protein M3R41_01175 [Pseudomonadota bacterium]|nr:hypothetical protein [Pseudomonadota bacterium]